MTLKRRNFYKPEEVVAAMQAQLNKLNPDPDSIDYLTFVADGEPTLDLNLGNTIQAVGAFGIKVAVITNSSLLWDPQVRKELQNADLVSIKIDAAHERSWRRINRPHPELGLEAIKESLAAFANEYQGKLITETMLLQDLNDGLDEADALAKLLTRLNPACSYLALPTRPPAEKWALPCSTERLTRFYQTLEPAVPNLEYLIGYEGNAFASTGNARDDLLSITAVHPMREDAVAELLKHSAGGMPAVRKLIEQGLLSEVEFGGYRYYLRKPKTSP